MNAALAIFRREFGSYFATPLAAVFIVIFLLLSGTFTFFLGDFFEAGQADLQVFFRFHPWLYLLLVPAVAMGLWAEERKSGTLELLLTQPVTLWQAVLGGLGIALLPTFIVGKDLQAGRLQAVLAQYVPSERNLHALYLQNRHLAAAVHRCRARQGP